MCRAPLFVLLSLVLAQVCVNFSTSPVPNACPQPLITEYLKNYQIATNDLKQLIDSSISSLTIPAVSNKQVKFTQAKMQIKYVGDQSVSQISPIQINVADSFAATLTWSANVSKTIGHNSYNLTAEIKNIRVVYVKTYVVQANQFRISNVTYNFTSDMIVVTSYKPDASSGDKTKMENLIKNQFYNAINQQLKSLSSWLDDIAKKQKIASAYPNDTYQYNYYGWILPIDTKTLTLTSDGNRNYVHGYRGDIVGQTDEKCPTLIPKAREQYDQYISLQFMQNFAKAVGDRYQPYKNILINSSWVRTDTFQFRLVDLQYVLSGASQKYGQYYMKPVTFTCSIKEIVSGYITTNNLLNQLIKWSCYGYLWTSNQTSVQIMDMEVLVSHVIQISLNGDTLSVLDNSLNIVDATFNNVAEIIVKDKELAKIYMLEFLNNMRTYVTGTFFNVKKGSTRILLQPDAEKGAGIWIG